MHEGSGSMSYTDPVIYKLRSCIEKYTSAALMLRDIRYQDEVLDRELAACGLSAADIRADLPNQKIDDITSKPAVDAFDECKQDYIAALIEVESRKLAVREKKKLLSARKS